MLTDAQVRKIKPAEKKTKYSDEKGMYLDSSVIAHPDKRMIDSLL